MYSMRWMRRSDKATREILHAYDSTQHKEAKRVIPMKFEANLTNTLLYLISQCYFTIIHKVVLESWVIWRSRPRMLSIEIWAFQKGQQWLHFVKVISYLF